jgi:hypothetical protein
MNISESYRVERTQQMKNNVPPAQVSMMRNAVKPSWLLGAMFVLAIIGAFSLGGTTNAANTPSMHLNSPPVSPINTPSPLATPTPAAPRVFKVQPGQGVNDDVVRINIYGAHFIPDSRVYLLPANSGFQSGNPDSTLPSGAIRLRSMWISRFQLMAKIPEGVRPGMYDIAVKTYPGLPAGVLENAYLALSSDPFDTDDLTAEPYNLWTAPETARIGEQSTIGLRVHRLGGMSGLPPFSVDFYVDEVVPSHFIGRATVPGISPSSSANTSGVSWTPHEGGEVTLIAIIDPDNQIRETNENNNRIERTIVVRRLHADDHTPPQASNLQVNNGAEEISDPDVTLTVEGTDPGEPSTGVSQVLYVELQWLSNVGAGRGSWYPVKWSDWLPFGEQPHEWTLYPVPGLRYMQAWVADGAGNISSRPAMRRVSYIPAADEVSQGETRVYRKFVSANQCLRVTLVPAGSSMDPDLYVWYPSYTSYNSNFTYSINGPGQTDEVVIQPTESGLYQIEVDGLTDATYQITIDVQAACAAASGMTFESAAATGAKQPRNEPTIPVDDEPGDNVMSPDSPGEYLLFLPTTARWSSTGGSGPQQGNFSIYLPTVAK